VIPVAAAYADPAIDWAPAPEVRPNWRAPKLGPEDARFEVVVFVDFGCATCATAVDDLKVILPKHPAKARIEPFPDSGACNPTADMGHDGRCDAALIAVCAAKLDRYDALSAWLYAHPEPDRESAAKQAKRLGIEPSAWEACMSSPAIASSVEWSVGSGNHAGVGPMPDFFVHVAEGWVEVPNLVGVDAVLTAAESGPLPPPARPPLGPRMPPFDALKGKPVAFVGDPIALGAMTVDVADLRGVPFARVRQLVTRHQERLAKCIAGRTTIVPSEDELIVAIDLPTPKRSNIMVSSTTLDKGQTLCLANVLGHLRYIDAPWVRNVKLAYHVTVH
jgi:hypothetical protein